jgi:hypothetical protein
VRDRRAASPGPTIRAVTPAAHLFWTRVWLTVLVVGLVLSGVTAFPLVSESGLIVRALRPYAGQVPTLYAFLQYVHQGLADTGRRYPFIAYGTDWLAFAHLTIAVAFWGPLRDPVRNVWVVQFGMIACAGIVPLALICGPLRGLPFFWTCVDLSFAVGGIVPLALAYRHIRKLARPISGIAQQNHVVLAST